MKVTRRSLLKTSVAVSAGASLGSLGGSCPQLPQEAAQDEVLEPEYNPDAWPGDPGPFFGYVPFSQPLFIPEVLTKKDFGTLNPPPGNYPGPRVDWAGGPRPLDHPDKDPHPELVRHGIAKQFDPADPEHCVEWNQFDANTHVAEYCLVNELASQKFAPTAPDTKVLSYRDGMIADANLPPIRTPGPTVVSRFRGPVVVRNENRLTKANLATSVNHDVETSIHAHGIHAPAHADGYPDFYTIAGEARDYYYPNIAPPTVGGGCGTFDETWIPSTLWYHDHAMDITGFTVANGLAGFYLVVDDVELELIKTGVLPSPGKTVVDCLDIEGNNLAATAPDDPGHDIGLALTDQLFDAQGQLVYDFFDHDGRLGDVFTVNGRVQPYFEVERRQYRFRILNASNARLYELRLRHAGGSLPFVVIGADSWLFPVAVVDPTGDIDVGMGERHDVIVDFRGLADGTEVYLENILQQEGGRGPDEVDPDKPTPLLKFIVKGVADEANSTNVVEGTRIRGFAADFECETTAGLLSFSADGGQWAPIDPADVVAEREFRFDRSHGAWTVNGAFFNPRRADAVPELGTTERWFFTNNSGGWWHPIHTHLEGFQTVRQESAPGGQRPYHCFNNDLVVLEGGDEAELLVRWRGFSGPFVFHCHNVEHEDMRMMGVNDPRPPGEDTMLDGESEIDPVVSGVAYSCEALAHDGRILFDKVGDVETLEDRGVGIFDEETGECDFDIDGGGND
jgi:FtsP/CotA-like multicopper oxidase with cupredoxin domain